MGFELGDPVRIEMEKWGGRPHWQIPARWLGSDPHGDWLGIPAGTRMSRPGLEVVSEFDQVGLIPAAGASDVIRMRNGWVVVDDEDEFAEHQVELGYPQPIIELAEASRDRVHAAILDEDAPYDGSHERWQTVLEGLSART